MNNILLGWNGSCIIINNDESKGEATQHNLVLFEGGTGTGISANPSK